MPDPSFPPVPLFPCIQFPFFSVDSVPPVPPNHMVALTSPFAASTTFSTVSPSSE